MYNWFRNAKMPPKKGSFIAWKKAYLTAYGWDGCIIKLEIPEDAIRIKGRDSSDCKCRASEAKVLEIYREKHNIRYDGVLLPNDTIAYSWHDPSFTYKVGDIVKPTEEFDTDRRNTCSTGIHFFMDREDAENF